ncbi:transporter substrate-binding domain-containing protein [Shewanella mesophila]|uniref:substrate-binding periplasmic protein n=1 Tax=Shewanella mesophila TaxID=2864208 RepID=UPI001C6614FA|nr:transporter substrate-binding domain-containing protein [Shewanella mesophila]QYJ86946.1 transporter substrate-binding domain-containing protein [Shewanella mesophila]
MMFVTLQKLTALTVIFCLFPNLTWGKETVTLCAEPIKVGFNDWAPYSWIDTSDNAVGLDVDMLTLIAANLGCEVDFIKMPVKRAHQMLKVGSLDMLMGASYTKDRNEYAYFSKSYRDEEIRLFVTADKASEITINQWQDIFNKKLTLLAPSYGWYGKDYLKSKAELIRQNLLVISPTTVQSVQMLAYGRGDILIGDAISLPYVANHSEDVAITPLALIVDSNKIHFMISKKAHHSELLEEIDQAISTLSNHGALARVVNKWQQISVAKTLKPCKEIIPSTGLDGAINITGHGSNSYVK